MLVHAHTSVLKTLTTYGLTGFILRLSLNFHQPTAIKALVDFEDSWIGGGVLAEDYGLEKTIEVIGLLLFRSNERRRLIKENQPVPKAKPTLILVSCTLVSQWVREIIRFTSRFHEVVYRGISGKVKQRNATYYSGKLTRNSKYFNGCRHCIINPAASSSNRSFLL
jgi:SNF2 family DNA or RNA helicase